MVDRVECLHIIMAVLLPYNEHRRNQFQKVSPKGPFIHVSDEEIRRQRFLVRLLVLLRQYFEPSKYSLLLR